MLKLYIKAPKVSDHIYFPNININIIILVINWIYIYIISFKDLYRLIMTIKDLLVHQIYCHAFPIPNPALYIEFTINIVSIYPIYITYIFIFQSVFWQGPIYLDQDKYIRTSLYIRRTSWSQPNYIYCILYIYSRQYNCKGVYHYRLSINGIFHYFLY